MFERSLCVCVCVWMNRCEGGWETQRWVWRSPRLKPSSHRVPSVRMDRICGTHTSPLRTLAAPTALEGITSHTPPAHCANPAYQAHGTRPKTARSDSSISSFWLNVLLPVYCLVYFIVQHLSFTLIIGDVKESEHKDRTSSWGLLMTGDAGNKRRRSSEMMLLLQIYQC